MPSKRDEMKAKLMAEVEAMLDEALAKGEGPLTIDEIEELTLTARDQVAQSLLGSLVEQQVEQDIASLPECPECGKRMHTKGKKGRYLRTRAGEKRFERDYFYCAACQQGHFPPG